MPKVGFQIRFPPPADDTQSWQLSVKGGFIELSTEGEPIPIRSASAPPRFASSGHAVGTGGGPCDDAEQIVETNVTYGSDPLATTSGTGTLLAMALASVQNTCAYGDEELTCILAPSKEVADSLRRVMRSVCGDQPFIKILTASNCYRLIGAKRFPPQSYRRSDITILCFRADRKLAYDVCETLESLPMRPTMQVIY